MTACKEQDILSYKLGVRSLDATNTAMVKSGSSASGVVESRDSACKTKISLTIQSESDPDVKVIVTKEIRPKY